MKLDSHRIAGWALGIYLILSVSHYRAMTRWDSDASTPTSILVLGLLVLLVAILMGRPIRGISRPSLTGIFILLFFMWSCVVAVLFGHETMHAVFSSVAALILVVFFMTYQDDIQAGRVLHVAGMCLAAYLAFLFAILPLRMGLTLGGIQPNQFAKLGLAVLVLGHCTSGWFRWGALLLGTACALIATSRASMVFIAAFIMVYYLPAAPMKRAVTLAVGGTATVFLLLADGLINTGLSAALGEKVLLLNDPRLGLGSGFSGRDVYWANGLQAISQNIMGWGFNTRGHTSAYQPWEVNAHQGYLNMILETGIFGLMFFVAALVSFLTWVRSVTPRTTVSRTGYAFGLSYPLIMGLDPIYFAITLPLSAIFLGFLSSGFGRPAVFPSRGGQTISVT